MRTVILPQWLWTARHKDRHPQGVILHRPNEPDKFMVYRSHKTPEKALASAESLNKTHRRILASCGIEDVEFEAVMFGK